LGTPANGLSGTLLPTTTTTSTATASTTSTATASATSTSTATATATATVTVTTAAARGARHVMWEAFPLCWLSGWPHDGVSATVVVTVGGVQPGWAATLSLCLYIGLPRVRGVASAVNRKCLQREGSRR
jgi:hypothetical protein